MVYVKTKAIYISGEPNISLSLLFFPSHSLLTCIFLSISNIFLILPFCLLLSLSLSLSTIYKNLLLISLLRSQEPEEDMTGEVLQTISGGSGFGQSSSTVDHDESLINPPLVKKKRNLPGNPGNYLYLI